MRPVCVVCHEHRSERQPHAAPGQPGAGSLAFERMRPAAVEFTDSGDGRVAYQTFGEGEPYVHVKSLGISLEMLWEHPGHLRAWGQIARVARVILFDERGGGLSDAVPYERVASTEGRIEDALAVMGASNAERACVQGEGDGTFAGRGGAGPLGTRRGVTVRLGNTGRRRCVPGEVGAHQLSPVRDGRGAAQPRR